MTTGGSLVTMSMPSDAPAHTCGQAGGRAVRHLCCHEVGIPFWSCTQYWMCSAGQKCTVKTPGENLDYGSDCKNGAQVDVFDTATCPVTCHTGYYHEYGDKTYSCLPNNDRNSPLGRLQKCIPAGDTVFVLSIACKIEWAMSQFLAFSLSLQLSPHANHRRLRHISI